MPPFDRHLLESDRTVPQYKVSKYYFAMGIYRQNKDLGFKKKKNSRSLP